MKSEPYRKAIADIRRIRELGVVVRIHPSTDMDGLYVWRKERYIDYVLPSGECFRGGIYYGRRHEPKFERDAGEIRLWAGGFPGGPNSMFLCDYGVDGKAVVSWDNFLTVMLGKYHAKE